MRAIVVEKPGSVSLRELPMPQPTAGWARIRVLMAAFCATDLEAIDGNIKANYPITLGHEWSGVVDAVNGPEQHFVRAFAGDASTLAQP